MKLEIGERMTVRLEETPTTGYRWRVEDGCAGILAVEDDVSDVAAAPPGAAGRRRWLVRAVAQGRCELRFVSVRAWGETTIGKTIVFPIMVRGAS